MKLSSLRSVVLLQPETGVRKDLKVDRWTASEGVDGESHKACGEVMGFATFRKKRC